MDALNFLMSKVSGRWGQLPLRSTSRIPQEVFDYILCHVRDPRTLKACILVCKAWVPGTRPHLFKRAIFTTQLADYLLDIHVRQYLHRSSYQVPQNEHPT